jgi:DNA-binding MarR family transcriptional regulator
VNSIFDSSDQNNIDRKIAVGFERISEVLKTLIWEESKQIGLSPIQIQFLVTLLYEGKSEWTIGDIASRFRLTPATVSDAVSSLEQKELAVRERKPDDRRAVLIRLSPKGKRLAKKLSQWANTLQQQVEVFDEKEKGILLRSLVSIISGFQRHGLISIAKMCVTCSYFRPNVHKNSTQPHHCAYIDEPLGESNLRVDCPDYERIEV